MHIEKGRQKEAELERRTASGGRDEARTKGRKINVDNFRLIRHAFFLPSVYLSVDRLKSDGDGDGDGGGFCSCALVATSRSFSSSQFVENPHIRPKVGLP